MAYVTRERKVTDRGEVWRDEHTPLCDSCADAGAVAFEVRSHTRHTGEVISDRWQLPPHVWYPLWGAACSACGKRC